MLDAPSQAIDLLGGKHVVSEITKKPLTTVASWAARESIPVGVWPPLIDFAKERGIKKINYESMARAHANAAAKPAKRRKAA